MCCACPLTHPYHLRLPASLQGTFIGAVTLTGSVVAFGKLHGLLNSKPLNIWGAFSGGPALWILVRCRIQALCEPGMRLQGPSPPAHTHTLPVTRSKHSVFAFPNPGKNWYNVTMLGGCVAAAVVFVARGTQDVTVGVAAIGKPGGC